MEQREIDIVIAGVITLIGFVLPFGFGNIGPVRFIGSILIAAIGLALLTTLIEKEKK